MLFDTKYKKNALHLFCQPGKVIKTFIGNPEKSMKIKRYIPAFLALFFIVFTGCKTGEGNTECAPPNIIILLTDDQGWGDLSRNGNPDLHTPNIDRLAGEGVVFDHFYVCPLCAPTRAEMLTGRYYLRTGVTGVSEGRERLNLDETTMADVFRDAGYVTAAFGKWHNGTQHPYHPNGRGFDEYYGFTSGHWGNYFSPLLDHNGEMVTGEGYLSDDLTGRAIEFIRKHRDDPFFVYIPFNIPHSPMQVPDKAWERFRDKELTTTHANRYREDVGHTRAAYAMCENIDMNVGRIMDALEETELEEETIVIYFSDNGPNGWRWNGGMKGKKGHIDEGGVRSPFIMRWTGTLEAGRHVEEIAGAIDLLPTLAELAGIDLLAAQEEKTGIDTETEKPLDGISLVPLLSGPGSEQQPITGMKPDPLLLVTEDTWEPRYLVSTWNNGVSIRSQRFRLDGQDRLYDMERDPGQTTDVSGRFPDVHTEMLAYKTTWTKEVLSAVPNIDTRTFPVGHPDVVHNQLPARDAVPHGGIRRSNQYPNCSFLEHWTSPDDSITWEVEVLAEGEFEATVYYTCGESNTGSTVKLSSRTSAEGTGRLRSGGSATQAVVTVAHDPPLEGMQYDRIPRQESYTKDFIPMTLGRIRLDKGNATLVLKAIEIPGDEVMDVRMLMLERVD